KLLLTAFHLALENDAEAVIWKDTYRVIEDYRGKLSSMYKKGASNTADESAPIIKDFNAFLNEATSFYLELVKELDKTFGVDISTQIKQQNDPLFGTISIFNFC
ncbi:Smg-6, nonsense mediated mRNA decay factor, partial [Entomophthora muscae]